MQNVAVLVMHYMTLKLKSGNWYKTGQANGALSLSPSDFCTVDFCLPCFHLCVMLLSYFLFLELGMYPQHVLLINFVFPGHFKAPFRLRSLSNMPPETPTVINWDLRIYQDNKSQAV